MPPGLELAAALSCELDEPALLRAAARVVACQPADGFGTMTQVVEAWEAGLLSGLEHHTGLLSFVDRASLGCDSWRCMARADSCEEAAACRSVAATCEPFVASCDGDRITTCREDGAATVPGFDCASVGARCDDGRCHIAECHFGGRSGQLACNGDDLMLCDGALRVSCDAWLPGSACASFALGGEVPTYWCSRTGDVSALYNRDVECEGSTVSLRSEATSRTYTVDCAAIGFSSCDRRGCVL